MYWSRVCVTCSVQSHLLKLLRFRGRLWTVATKRSDVNSLDLVERDLLAEAVVELRSAGGLVSGDAVPAPEPRWCKKRTSDSRPASRKDLTNAHLEPRRNRRTGEPPPQYSADLIGPLGATRKAAAGGSTIQAGPRKDSSGPNPDLEGGLEAFPTLAPVRRVRARDLGPEPVVDHDGVLDEVPSEDHGVRRRSITRNGRRRRHRTDEARAGGRLPWRRRPKRFAKPTVAIANMPTETTPLSISHRSQVPALRVNLVHRNRLERRRVDAPFAQYRLHPFRRPPDA